VKRISIEKLKKLRKAKGLTAAQLSKLIGAHREYIYCLERQNQKSSTYLSKICKVLECKKNNLLVKDETDYGKCIDCGVKLTSHNQKRCGSVATKTGCAYENYKKVTRESMRKKKELANKPKQQKLVSIPNYRNETVSYESVLDTKVIQVHSIAHPAHEADEEVGTACISASKISKYEREYNGFIDATTHL